MKKLINWIRGTFLCIGVLCYCIWASFVLLFKDEE